MVCGTIGTSPNIARLAIIAITLSISPPSPAFAQVKQVNVPSEADQVKSLSGLLEGLGSVSEGEGRGRTPTSPPTSDLWGDVQAWNRQEATREVERQRLAAIEADRQRAAAEQAEQERALAAQSQSSGGGGFLDTLLNVATAGVATYSAAKGVYNPALMSAATGGEIPLPNIVPAAPIRPPQATPTPPARPVTVPDPASSAQVVCVACGSAYNQQPVWDATKQHTPGQHAGTTAPTQAARPAPLPAPTFNHSGSWRTGANGAADYVVSIVNNGQANLQCDVAIAAMRYQTSSSPERYGSTENFRDQRTAFVYRGRRADVDWRGLTGPNPNYTVNCRSVN